MSHPGLGSKRARPSSDDDGDLEDERPTLGLGAKRTAMSGGPLPVPGQPGAAPSDGAAASAAPATGFNELQMRLMAMAGYKGSGGLGRQEQGRLAPVEASTQVSRRGHGFRVAKAHHEFEEQRVQVEIPVEWLPQPQKPVPLPDLATMRSWARMATRPDDDGLDHVRAMASSASSAASGSGAGAGSGSESAPAGEAAVVQMFEEFRELREMVQAAKSPLDNIDRDSLLKARQRSNPFELIRAAIFCNRAAVKMAEIDRICDRLFTIPPAIRPNYRPPPGTPPQQLAPRRLVYFADICAGPGGFSEYMLTALKWRAKGFGFTLIGELDFMPSKFNSNAPPHTFKAYYGQDDTGDITVTDNMRHFAAQVAQETKNYGVHVVMADGGFDFTNQQDNQEVVAQQLVLCQIALAMAILAQDGVFVLKVYDIFLPLSVDLIYLMRMHFHQFAIIKPNQSRPANSERYIVGKGFRQRNPAVVEYLFGLNDRMNEFQQKSVPLSNAATILKKAPQFVKGGSIGGTEPLADTASFEHKAADPVTAANTGSGEQAGDDGLFGDEAFSASSPPRFDFEDDEPGAEPGGPASAAAPAVELGSAPPAPPALSGASEAADAAASAPVAASSGPQRLVGCVDPRILAQDAAFIEYVEKSNATIAGQQVAALERLVKYVEDTSLPMDDQEAIRERCLKYWGIPSSITLEGVAGGLGGGDDGTFGFSSDDKGALQRQLQIKEQARQRRRQEIEEARARGQYIVYDPDYGKVLLSAEPQRVFPEFGPGEPLYNQRVVHQMRAVLPLLPLPTPEEWLAIKSGSAEFSLAAVQLQQMQRVADWSVFALPAGGKRFTLMAGPRCSFLATAQGITSIDWLQLPSDTILDVVVVGAEVHVLDAWCLPTEIELYEKRPEFEVRMQFVSMFVEAVRQPMLRWTRPMSFRRLLQESPFLTQPPKPHDLFFVHGNGPKPWPMPLRVWRARPEDHARDRADCRILPPDRHRLIPETPCGLPQVRQVVKYLLDEDFKARQLKQRP